MQNSTNPNQKGKKGASEPGRGLRHPFAIEICMKTFLDP